MFFWKRALHCNFPCLAVVHVIQTHFICSADIIKAGMNINCSMRHHEGCFVNGSLKYESSFSIAVLESLTRCRVALLLLMFLLAGITVMRPHFGNSGDAWVLPKAEQNIVPPNLKTRDLVKYPLRYAALRLLLDAGELKPLLFLLLH